MIDSLARCRPDVEASAVSSWIDVDRIDAAGLGVDDDRSCDRGRETNRATIDRDPFSPAEGGAVASFLASTR